MIDRYDIEYKLAGEAKGRLTSKHTAGDIACASYVNIANNYVNRARAAYSACPHYGLTC